MQPPNKRATNAYGLQIRRSKLVQVPLQQSSPYHVGSVQQFCLETRFGPSTYDNHQAALFKLQQTSTVTAYQTEFERLSNCVVGLPPEALLNCFVSGLRQDIQQELAILRPHTITHGHRYLRNFTRGQKKMTDFRHPKLSLTAAPAPTSEALAIKRLSPAEMQQRRVDGLCFNCPEKYSPGHKCNPPKFLLLQTGHDPPLDLRVQSSNNVIFTRGVLIRGLLVQVENQVSFSF
ncbi:transposon ty3-G gag-pol polyprotein [Tanacetum coccineum]